VCFINAPINSKKSPKYCSPTVYLVADYYKQMSDSESEGSTIYDEKSEAPQVYDDSHVKVRKTRSDKGKKERTPAQQAATQKALLVLKERREAINKAAKQTLDTASDAERQRILAEKYEAKKARKQKLPPAPSYVTLGDFENFKRDLIGAMPKQVYKAVEIEKVARPKKEVPVAAPVAAPVVAPVAAQVAEKSKQLSGHALLDQMFFNNR
jgi:hypothetical protein